MTHNTQRKFVRPDGSFDTEAAMRAGHEARAEALSRLARRGKRG